MNRITIVFLVLLGFFAACSTGNEREIPLYNNYHFQKDSSERLVEIDSLGKLPYIQYFNNIDDIQIPLYRIIAGRDYMLYLGVPFHTNIAKIKAARAASPNADSVLTVTEGADHYYRQVKKGELYLTEYMQNLDSVSMICVFGSTPNQQLASSLMSESALSGRIKK